MEHLIFLLNLLTLIAGLMVFGALVRAWRLRPDPRAFWQLVHFAGFSVTMVAAALDAYCVVNLGSGVDLIRLWSALIVVGAALMVLAFPHLARVQAGKPRPPRFQFFWAALASVTLMGAGLVLFVQDYQSLLVVLFLAFLPLWASIFYGLAVGSRSQDRSSWKGWAAFLVLLAVAALEIWWFLTHPAVHGYYFVTLPLAYLYVVWTTWRDRTTLGPSPSTGVLTVPPALVSTLGLTPREREMAEGILRGRTNKELAFELGLSENTIRNHIANLYRKLGIQKRLDLVLLVQKYQGE